MASAERGKLRRRVERSIFVIFSFFSMEFDWFGGMSCS